MPSDLAESSSIVTDPHYVLSILLVIGTTRLWYNLIVIQLISFLLTISLLLPRRLPLAFQRL